MVLSDTESLVDNNRLSVRVIHLPKRNQIYLEPNDHDL